MRVLCIFLVLVNIAYFLWQAGDQDASVSMPIDEKTPSLMLLSELSSAPSKLSNSAKTEEIDKVIQTESANTVIPNEAVSQTNECVELSGFIDKTSAEKAVELLSGHGITAKVNILEIQSVGSYLVYLPPFESRAIALTKLHELKAKGVDSFIIAEGARMNGISLGVFSKEESAKKLQAQLKSKNYNALLVNAAHENQQFTLQITKQADAMLAENIRAEVSQKYAEGKLTGHDSSCHE
jgi:hypothetical protein